MKARYQAAEASARVSEAFTGAGDTMADVHRSIERATERTPRGGTRGRTGGVESHVLLESGLDEGVSIGTRPPLRRAGRRERTGDAAGEMDDGKAVEEATSSSGRRQNRTETLLVVSRSGRLDSLAGQRLEVGRSGTTSTEMPASSAVSRVGWPIAATVASFSPSMTASRRPRSAAASRKCSTVSDDVNSAASRSPRRPAPRTRPSPPDGPAGTARFVDVCTSGLRPSVSTAEPWSDRATSTLAPATLRTAFRRVPSKSTRRG